MREITARRHVTIDGNEAAAYVAHRTNEVIVICPNAPSSAGETNVWGSTPLVVEMPSEGGAAAVVRGSLQAGSLTTMFTSSQGLRLMIPEMCKIAGELMPTVFHVAAGGIAAQDLSIFGDHQDVMAVQKTGFALLASDAVQTVMDMALIAQAATLESRLPFVHFFDGFRTSHEVATIERVTANDMRALLRRDLIRAHRDRPLNPDVYSRCCDAAPAIVQKAMDRFAAVTGRAYHLFDYHGAPDAERVLVLMGSAAATAAECVDRLRSQGERVGVLNVRLFRPFSVDSMTAALPKTLKALAVLDRTNEPGSAGEPLYRDVVAAMEETAAFPVRPRVIGERYGLGSEDFTPAMAAAVFDELRSSEPRKHFTIDIADDVTHGSVSYEPRRNLSPEIPVLDENLCIQCGKCVMVCPHAVIRAKICRLDQLAIAPKGFKSAWARWKDSEHMRYLLQVSPEDCTGCGLCVEICPAKDGKALAMAPKESLRETESLNWEFFAGIPEADRSTLVPHNVKDLQLLEPLFDYSGACSGCGGAPYVKMLTQLFGDRLVIANGTGCSSIFSGNLPARGSAWSNSLFEGNTEFGLGIRLSIDQQRQYARELLMRVERWLPLGLAEQILDGDESTEAGIELQRERVVLLRECLAEMDASEAQDLLAVVSTLVRKSVWIIGRDVGGLDHTLKFGHNVKMLLLSEPTPHRAVAQFAAAGKAIGYGNVYVAQVALGANGTQTVKALLEAEAYDGPALVIAYAHCIDHGLDIANGLTQQKAAVDSGYWPLFRYNPALASVGRNPFQV